MKQYYIVLVSLLCFHSVSFANDEMLVDKFTQCMPSQVSNMKSAQIIFSQNSPLYNNILQSTIQNPRFVNDSASYPLLILTPFHESEIQAAVLCSKKYDIQIRVRSGGHDYEGLSYLCDPQSILIDFKNLKSVEVDVKNETAWVQSGATLGQLYYAIAQKSNVHGFPAGLCPTVGVGGHFSGGGFGTLVRKYGTAADQVVDAYIVDVNGKLLDRKGMGEDLFWAIRGGGGASFGIIVSWKVKIVRVPPTLTSFTVLRKLKEGATPLIQKWQRIVAKLPEDIFIRIIIQNVDKGENKTVQAVFDSLFLGKVENLIPLMNEHFPEIGLKSKDCYEKSWIVSVINNAGYPTESPLSVLLNKTNLYKADFKSKSDFVTEPIPEKAFEGIWKHFLTGETVYIIMDPFGGKMNEISESEIPFPHRKGNLYNIQYLVWWNGTEKSTENLRWMETLYRLMTPYVSKSPRSAYLNYRDLDLGSNYKKNKTSYAEASVWGLKYFKGNFERLVQVKSRVDLQNFFRTEQSIPLK